MRRILAATCLIALPLLAASGARAADQPTLTPTRDVDITYRVAGPNGTAEQRVRWDVAGGRQRIDPPTPGLHIIVDTHTHHDSPVPHARDWPARARNSASSSGAGGAGHHCAGTSSPTVRRSR